MDFDKETRMPIPRAEILAIDVFHDIWKRKNKIDGDRDGTKKTLNTKEFGYIYFHTVYDSRFRLLDSEEKDIKIRNLLGLDKDLDGSGKLWQPDLKIKEAIKIYNEMQQTESLDHVDMLESTMKAITMWLKAKRPQIASGTMAPKDLGEIQDIIDRAPTTLSNLRKAKDVLSRDEDALASGRKGRRINKFEQP